MTKERKEIFLAELGRTGVFAHAARLASPNAKHGALNSFREERDRDPEFAAAWDEAVDVSTGIIEQEAIRRAVEGWDDGKVRKYSDRLMELILKRRDSAYHEHKTLEISGEVRQQQPSLDHLSDDDLRALKQMLKPCQDLGGSEPDDVTPTTTEPTDDRAKGSLTEEL